MNAAPTKIGSGIYVDHFANEPEQIAIRYRAGKYRVVRSWVVNGTLHEEPFDDLTFDGISQATQHRRDVVSISKAEGK